MPRPFGAQSTTDEVLAGVDLRGKNVGKAAAGLFLLQSGGGFRLVGALVEKLDHGAEQRLFGPVIVIDRLSRQPRFLGDLIHRGASVAKTGEDGLGRAQYSILGSHWTNFTQYVKLSTETTGWRQQWRPDQRGWRPGSWTHCSVS